MWFHEFMKRLRTDHRLSQYKCSNGVGLAPSPWRSIETGDVTPNLRTAVRIGDYLGFKVVLVCGRETYILSLQSRSDGKERVVLNDGGYTGKNTLLNELLNDLRPGEENQACLLLKTISDGRPAEPKKKTRKKTKVA